MTDIMKNKIANITTLDELYAIMKIDFYVIIPCYSRASPGKVLEGTRLTLLYHEPAGYEYTIRTAGTPIRWVEFHNELNICFDKFINAILYKKQESKIILKHSLEMFYYWVQFAPLSRGSAACGYAVLMTGMLASGYLITEPIPKGKQLDWEAILTPDFEVFYNKVENWFVIENSPFLKDDFLHFFLNERPKTLKEMIQLLSFEFDL
jgi:hypothetical protein